MKPVITSSIYCVNDDHVLLIKRRKNPFYGLWIAPGGKMEAGEVPRQTAIRELKEETGLVASKLTLRGIVRESSDNLDWQWLIFYYVATELNGNLINESREGALAWWPINGLGNLPIPEADRIFMRPILNLRSPVYEGFFFYDNEKRLIHFTDRS